MLMTDHIKNKHHRYPSHCHIVIHSRKLAAATVFPIKRTKNNTSIQFDCIEINASYNKLSGVNVINNNCVWMYELVRGENKAQA